MDPEMPERGTETSKLPFVWTNFEFFLRDQNDFLSDAMCEHGRNLGISPWPGDKATINRVAAQRLTPPCPKKFRVQKSTGKFLAWIFWDQDSILLIDNLPNGQTINAGYYSSLLGQMKDNLKEKPSGNFTKGVLFLHNSPTQWALATQRKLAYLGFQYLDHSPYSPVLAPSDYHLLPGLKKTI